jgi:hypothetical protein
MGRAIGREKLDQAAAVDLIRARGLLEDGLTPRSIDVLRGAGVLLEQDPVRGPRGRRARRRGRSGGRCGRGGLVPRPSPRSCRPSVLSVAPAVGRILAVLIGSLNEHLRLFGGAPARYRAWPGRSGFTAGSVGRLLSLSLLPFFSVSGSTKRTVRGPLLRCQRASWRLREAARCCLRLGESS